MIVEALIAFTLIFISTLAIYTLGKRSAPKTTISENEQASYACGEKVSFHGLKVNVSLLSAQFTLKENPSDIPSVRILLSLFWHGGTANDPAS